MKLPKACLIVALAPLLLTTHAMGALITWGSAQNVNPNDPTSVSTDGTLVTAAWMARSGTAVTTGINGVTFTDYAHASNLSTVPNFTNDGNPTWFYSTYPSAPAYAVLLGYNAYAYDNAVNGAASDLSTHPFTFSGLTPGATYQLQVWSAYFGALYTTRYSSNAPTTGPNYDTATNDSPSLVTGFANGNYASVTSQPQYVLGTFVADATTQTLYMHGDMESSHTYYVGDIGAFQLRAVPEPTTIALGALGASLLFIRARRRQRVE